MKTPVSPSDFILPFDKISLKDVPIVGGKNASLGELYQQLIPQGLKVPNGFAITAKSYFSFIESAGLKSLIEKALTGIDTQDLSNLQKAGTQIRNAIQNAAIPKNLEHEIFRAYDALSESEGRGLLSVAVRSSATAEDLPEASFAGQQETFLNIRGHDSLLDACRRCFASLFTDRAISYRHDMGFDHIEIGLSVAVQRMVRADLGSAGVLFTIDTESGFKDAILINASYGLGESIVKGSVNPDEFILFKPTIKSGFRPIIQKRLGTKETKMIYRPFSVDNYDIDAGNQVKMISVPQADRGRFSLDDEDLIILAKWGILVEEHYSALKRQFTPMDLEWAKDGETGELFILQARPETVQSRKSADTIEIYTLSEKGRVLVTGRSVGERIASGLVRIIKNVQDLHRLKPGDILVTEKTDPDWEPKMKDAASIITDQGGRTCHAAIVARELGLPAIVGTEHGSEVLKDGMKVTVSCAEGETGFVYEGQIPFQIKTLPLTEFRRPKTKIMMNLGNPDEAFKLSMLPNDGVGLARIEFIISNTIKLHPMALIHFDQIKDIDAKNYILQITQNYHDKSQYFVDRLAEGVATIAAAFYPKDVIVRLSDFKTNEYTHLIGGVEFEPNEENPMIGFRGASRYYNPKYREGFALECRAMKKVRDEMGLLNLKLMIPFCRTLTEAKRVIQELENNGLKRGKNGLEVYVMCEIPSNVILADQFAEFFDGFSIGSNDLTQLILGVDRDSEIIAHLFDERDPAVKAMISLVIKRAKRKGRKISICGQAPSDYPDFAEFLVNQGIDSISLNPDSIIKTTLDILASENTRARQKPERLTVRANSLTES